MPATVSAASGLLVPMTPVGPRLIQPAVYCPTSGCLVCGSSTRPLSLRMTPQSSLNGTPGSGTPRYPTERKTSPTGRSSNSPVAFGCSVPVAVA